MAVKTERERDRPPVLWRCWLYVRNGIWHAKPCLTSSTVDMWVLIHSTKELAGGTNAWQCICPPWSLNYSVRTLNTWLCNVFVRYKWLLWVCISSMLYLKIVHTNHTVHLWRNWQKPSQRWQTWTRTCQWRRSRSTLPLLQSRWPAAEMNKRSKLQRPGRKRRRRSRGENKFLRWPSLTGLLLLPCLVLLRDMSQF